MLREFDEAEDEADLSSSDNTTVIEGQLENWTDFCLLKAIEKLDSYEKMYLFLIMYTVKPRKMLILGPSKKVPKIAISADYETYYTFVYSKWDRAK